MKKHLEQVSALLESKGLCVPFQPTAKLKERLQVVSGWGPRANRALGLTHCRDYALTSGCGDVETQIS